MTSKDVAPVSSNLLAKKMFLRKHCSYFCQFQSKLQEHNYLQRLNFADDNGG